VIQGILFRSGFHFDFKNSAFDTVLLPPIRHEMHVGANHSLNFKTDTKTMKTTSKVLHACEEKNKFCAYKEEYLSFELPYLINHPAACIIVTVLEPLQWILSNNFIGVGRWYQYLVGHMLSPAAQSNLISWQKWWSGGRHGPEPPPRISPELYLEKGRLWSIFHAEILQLMKLHEKNTPMLLWRCGQDTADDAINFVSERCGFSPTATDKPLPNSPVGKPLTQESIEGIKEDLLQDLIEVSSEISDLINITKPNISKKEDRYFVSTSTA
jgi:hypothetical protein